jgi:hypothetical protein
MSTNSFDDFVKSPFNSPDSSCSSLSGVSALFMLSSNEDLRNGSLSSNRVLHSSKAKRASENAGSFNAELCCDKLATPKAPFEQKGNGPAPTPDAKPDTPKYVKHEKYYFKDGSVKLLVRFHVYAFDTRYDEELVQVGNVMYNLHRTILEHHSAWFRERFTSPPNMLLPGWTRHTSPHGDAFFVNHKLGQVSFTPPRVVDPATGAFVLDDVTMFSHKFDAFLSVLYPV